MRFRRLTLAELEPLEFEFKNFLAINGLSAPDWELIKRTKATETNALLDEFSDVVLLRALKNIATIELRASENWYLFRYDATMVYLIHIQSSNPKATNLSELVANDIFTNQLHINNLAFSDNAKPYTKGAREDELFAMMQNGATIAHNQLFDALWGAFGLELKYKLNPN